MWLIWNKTNNHDNRNTGTSGSAQMNKHENVSTTSDSAGTPTGTVTVSHSGGLETRPENVAFNYIIKTK